MKEVLRQIGDLETSNKPRVTAGGEECSAVVAPPFRTGIFCYPLEGSLLPRCFLDVVLFLNVFSNHRTASNYLTYFMFLCVFCICKHSLEARGRQVGLEMHGENVFPVARLTIQSEFPPAPTDGEDAGGLQQRKRRSMGIHQDFYCVGNACRVGMTVFAVCPSDAGLMTRDAPNALWVENCPPASKIACFRMSRRNIDPRAHF